MRVIDADAFLKDTLTAGIGKTIIEYSESDIGYMIRRRQTIDAVPVVRCKDCKHSDDECHKDNLRYCMRGIRADDYNETGYIYPVEEIVRDDDFCSYGERKEGADNGKEGQKASKDMR